MKILVKYHNPLCKLEKHGCWIDLRSAADVNIKKFGNEMIPLGVSMKLPKYFEANIAPRSGTFKNFGIIMANHLGVIDGPDDVNEGYSGNDDKWMFNAIAMRDSHISIGDRICQFKVVPSMSAPWYVKLKWIFDSKINFIEVDDLKSKNRGGFSSTGIK